MIYYDYLLLFCFCRQDIKYTNNVDSKNKQYTSQSTLLHDSDDSNYTRPTLVPIQELNKGSPKALNGIM